MGCVQCFCVLMVLVVQRVCMAYRGGPRGGLQARVMSRPRMSSTAEAKYGNREKTEWNSISPCSILSSVHKNSVFALNE